MLYAVWVRTGREADVARLLSQHEEITILPTARKVIYEWGSKEELLFPGYVFVKIKNFTNRVWHIIKNTLYVIKPLGIVKDEDQLIQLLEESEVDVSYTQVGTLENAIEEAAAAEEEVTAENTSLTFTQIKYIIEKIRRAITKPVIIGKKYRIRLPLSVIDKLYKTVNRENTFLVLRE